MYDVITLGSAMRDVIFKIPYSRFPYLKFQKRPLLCFRYGAKIEPEAVYFSFGGGALNSAYCFSRLRLKTAICARVGNDGTATAIFEGLQKEKIDSHLIQKDKKLHTALSFIVVGKFGERTIFPYAGASSNLKLSPSLKRVLPQTSWIYLTTLRGKSQKILSPLIKLVKKYQINLAFNPGNTELEKGLCYLKPVLKQTKVLLLNKEEAIKLVTSGSAKRITMEDLLSRLWSLGPSIVIITDGEKGAWAKSNEKIFYIKPPTTKLVEKTGAGDAFGSAFIAGLIHFNDLSTSLMLATFNAASVIGHYGATEGLLSFNKAMKQMKQVSLKVYERS